MSVRWSGLQSDFMPGEILVMPRLETSATTIKQQLLIADDDPSILEMLRQRIDLACGEEAYEIATCSSAEDALTILFETPIDLLITDYDFSLHEDGAGMNGLALLRAISEHRIVVTSVFMTGFGDEEVAKNAILEGASDYLMKPALKGLIKVVERCTDKHKERLEAAALRNAALLLDISAALNIAGGEGRGADLILKALLKEVDCDLAWVRLRTPGDNRASLTRCLRSDDTIPVPHFDDAPLNQPQARFADDSELKALFNERRCPDRTWVRPLLLRRDEGTEPEVLGELVVAYFGRGHRLHPGRRRCVEVIAHHTEGVLAQRFLRHELERSFSETIEVLVQALEMHDEYTAGHSDWVGVYARLGAVALGWDPRAVARAGHAGLLHDIGKVRLDSSMINHPGKLSDEQVHHFRAHPVIGAEMLKPLRSMEDMLPAVCWHHERFEGGGYPSGVASSLLPPLARLMCIADAYDAMTSHRAYRRAMSFRDAMRELRHCAGSQFDPAMVAPFSVALASFRRLVRHWAEAVIEQDQALRPSDCVDSVEALFQPAWSDTELAIEGEEAAAIRQACEEVVVPIAGIVTIFISLESGLNEAAEQFLTARRAHPDDPQALSAAMEEASGRPDHRLQRLITELWAERLR